MTMMVYYLKLHNETGVLGKLNQSQMKNLGESIRCELQNSDDTVEKHDNNYRVLRSILLNCRNCLHTYDINAGTRPNFNQAITVTKKIDGQSCLLVLQEKNLKSRRASL